jgi:hypothetical protein
MSAVATPLKFNKIAAQMMRRGVPIIPVAANDKNPLPKAWQYKASTKPQDILDWVAEYGNGINAGCVATPDGYWYLDADNPELWEIIERETAQKLPRTFTTATRKGQHKYWKQTDASRAMGNRKCHAAPYEYDAQVDRKQVIAPGSTHPSGFVYHIVDDAPIAEAPDWLVAWVSKQGEEDKPKPKRCTTVHEDFDFEDLMEFFEITGDWDGNWFITEACPVAEYKHEQSTKTGFYFDGTVLGFHDFAQGCEGSSMSVGDVLRFLNQKNRDEGKEIYKGVIWSDDFDKTDEEFLLDPKWNNAVEWVGATAEDPALTPEPYDICDLEEQYLKNVEACNSAREKVAVQNEQLKVQAPGPDDDYAEMFAEVAREMKENGEMPLDPEDFLPQPTDIAIEDPALHTGLEFPGDCAMYGKLKEIANRHSHLPHGWLYPSILIVASTLEIEDTDHFVRSNMYGALLGAVGTGKTYCLEAAHKSIYLPGEDTVMEDAPGSHSGLMNQLSEDEPVSKLLLIDELKTVLNACNIQGSSLPQMLCTLWNKDKVGGSVKKGRQVVYGKLSILGGLAVKEAADFARLFGSGTVTGLVDRFLLGYYDGYVKARPIRGLKRESFDIKPVVIPEWCWEAKDKWIDEDQDRRRLSEHALRVALVTAACNGDREITKPCLEAAFRLMEWQQRLRKVFKPGLAETKDAEALEAVFAALVEQFQYQQKHKKAPKGALDVSLAGVPNEERWKFIHYTDVLNNKSYYRRYGKLLPQIRKTLVDEGFMYDVKEDAEEDERGKAGKKGKTPFVVLCKLVN